VPANMTESADVSAPERTRGCVSAAETAYSGSPCIEDFKWPNRTASKHQFSVLMLVEKDAWAGAFRGAGLAPWAHKVPKSLALKNDLASLPGRL
jgi:hypothetical protein